jgi:hypothetical protein
MPDGTDSLVGHYRGTAPVAEDALDGCPALPIQAVPLYRVTHQVRDDGALVPALERLVERLLDVLRNAEVDCGQSASSSCCNIQQSYGEIVVTATWRGTVPLPG